MKVEETQSLNSNEFNDYNNTKKNANKIQYYYTFFITIILCIALMNNCKF
jgi:hypothetical protein